MDNKTEDARRHFEQAVSISKDCGELRYVDETQRDILAFLDVPAELLRERRPEIQLETVRDKFADEKHANKQIANTFAVLRLRREYFLRQLSESTGELTDTVAHWDTIHSEGRWHATVAVLVFDDNDRCLMQRRTEDDSKGCLDVSVSGHVDIGENAEIAAVREASEEIHVLLDAHKLTRVGWPNEFSKEGQPKKEDQPEGESEAAYDGHAHATYYQYETESGRMNRERVTLFVTRLPADTQVPEEVEVVWMSIDEAQREIEQVPNTLASSFKHFFGHCETVARIKEALAQLE